MKAISKYQTDVMIHIYNHNKSNDNVYIYIYTHTHIWRNVPFEQIFRSSFIHLSILSFFKLIIYFNFVSHCTNFSDNPNYMQYYNTTIITSTQIIWHRADNLSKNQRYPFPSNVLRFFSFTREMPFAGTATRRERTDIFLLVAQCDRFINT